eukprot:TRINITY_DN7128_c0_g1_i1.p1 TRINITY_DN7128_c0_g1~~TRINITY_DN7128_c0_g1_i1.p1  ORF type:complete len:301 (-),score=86.89 TRINITY_DN7128_c0_g1_i1:639-1541(-)
MEKFSALIELSVFDESKVITYRYLSREYALPSNTSKQILADFAKKWPEEVEPVYLIAGKLKKGETVNKENTGTFSHVVKLVDESGLDDTKKMFSSITSLHVYSVQKKIPKDNALVLVPEKDQLKQKYNQQERTHISDVHFFDQCSAVKCVDVKRRPLSAKTSVNNVNSNNNNNNGNGNIKTNTTTATSAKPTADKPDTKSTTTPSLKKEKTEIIQNGDAKKQNEKEKDKKQNGSSIASAFAKAEKAEKSKPSEKVEKTENGEKTEAKKEPEKTEKKELEKKSSTVGSKKKEAAKSTQALS